ncbi:ABC-2 type transport system permease protein [Oxalobacteraceae bacterium GrIS 1.11]
MLKILLHLIRADLALFLRAKLALFWTFAFPLLMLVMQMALFGHNVKLGPVSLAIVDLDRSAASVDYVRQLGAGLRVQQSVEFKRLGEAEAAGADFALTIPAGFGANVAAGRGTELALGGKRGGGPAQDAAYGMLRGMSDAYNLSGLTGPQRVTLPPPPETGAGLDYGLYLVTGLAGMIILSTGLIGFAGPLVAAREGGMFRLYQLFPMRTGLVVLAWWLSRLAITMVASLLMFLIAALVYGVKIQAGAAAIGMALLVLALGTGAFLSLGLLIASVSNSVAAATMVCNLLYFPLLFSGNLMIPVGGLPKALRALVDCLPLNAMVGSIRRCVTTGLEWHAEAYSVAMLAAMLLVCLMLSARRFSWMPRSS